MTLDEILVKRRSIRSYSNKDIDNSLVEKIIEAGSLAPSAMNKQPWNLVVVKDIDLKNKIADRLISFNEKFERTANVIKTAPVIILVFNEDKDDLVFSTSSNAAFIENMLLKATDLGISSLWIGLVNHIEEDVKEWFNRHQCSLTATIALGYSLEEPKTKETKKLNEFVEWK